MLEAHAVSFRIDDKALLQNVDLALHPAEVLAVIGPNGAGKSTLARLLSGEIEPSQGQVHMNARPLKDWSLRERAKVRAVLPQHSSLQFAFKVLDIVMMGRSPHSESYTRHDQSIARAALDKADVAHLAERLYPSLSGGERQRVHLARVLAQIWDQQGSTSRYLLLDEPTSALDLPHQHATLSIARSLSKEQGVGVLIVLHDLNLAALYADRIALMQSSQLKCIGTPTEVLQAGLVEEVFKIPVSIATHPFNRDCPLVIAHPL